MKIFIAILFTLTLSCFATTLKEAYDTAGSGEGYDKVVVLEKGKIYKGGLSLGWFYNPFTFSYDSLDEKSVKISGNGAILDLMNGQIHIAYTNMNLDIDSCVIMNGTLRFTGCPDGGGGYTIPYGNVQGVTFYNSIDFGIRMEGSGLNMNINRNLIVDCLSSGPDFPQYNSLPAEALLTGTSFSFSAFDWYGIPQIKDNWSYNSSFQFEPLKHFSKL